MIQGPIIEEVSSCGDRSGELETFGEVKTYVSRVDWMRAMQAKMESLYDNHTYELVALPKGKRALKSKWVYRIRKEEGSTKPRCKVRLVVKGSGKRKALIWMKSSL